MQQGAPKKKMSLLRRHRILEDDVRRVIAHLTAHKRITANDTISRPRLKKKKDAGTLEGSARVTNTPADGHPLDAESSKKHSSSSRGSLRLSMTNMTMGLTRAFSAKK